MPMHLPTGSHRCVKQNGSSPPVVCKQTTARQRTPSHPLVGPKLFWLISADIHIHCPAGYCVAISREGVAISNSRLISADADTVAFGWKDYRIKSGERQKVMRLATGEFIRRFLIHVLPDGFHRIRHYGLLASANRKTNIAKIRTLLGAIQSVQNDEAVAEIVPLTLREPCPCCGGPMRITEIFRRGQKPMSRAPPREQAT